MIKNAKKYLKNSTLLLVIGVSLLLGCPSSGDQTTVLPISSSIPASGATNFSADGNIVLTYNQAIVKGEGVITLLTYLPSVGKRVTIAISDTQVSIAGNVVTIDPPIDLDMGISYILTIPAGVFLNAAGGNAIPADTLFFSTAPAIDITAPAISAAMSVGGATDLSANADIILTFDEPILKGSGEIILTPTVGAPITIAVSDPRVTIVGGVVTIDPMADLALDTAYTLTIPAGAFVDASGNSSPPDTQSFMTAMALDTTLPTVNSSVPANNATGVAVDANIVLTYDEAVQKGSGSITLQPTGGTVVTIPISTAQVSVSGSVVTINPTVDLLAGTDYTLMVPAGPIEDLAGNSAGSLTLSFATAAALDTTPPTINSSAPASGATINAFDNIVLMYSEALQKGSGSITLQPSVGTLVTIPISSAQVSVVAGVVAIDPTADLLAGTSYTLSFPAGVFQDLAGNSAGSFTLNFNTAVPLDTTSPTISSRVPANNAMNVNIGANVVLTYNEAVQKGSGSITLSSAFGNISVPVSNSLVSISGNVVTIDPMVDLLAGTAYTLSFPAGVFQDLAGNNAGSLTLNFSTAAALDTTPPTIASSVPANGATNVNIGANIVLTYSEAVQKGSGSITLQRSGGGMVTIPVSSAQVSIAGAVVTINPTADLLDGTAYTLSFPAGVFQDLAGNNAGSLTRSFTTAVALDSTPPTINSSVPAIGGGGTINSPDNIVLTYSEAVQKGSGNITIGAITIPVSSAQVSIAGAVVTINPSADLLTGTSYTLSFSAGVFQDLAGNNAGSLTLNFNTAAALDTTPPTIASSVPANGATGVDVGANIVLTYSEAVQKGSGSMTISSAGGMVTISVSSALVSVAGAVVTINPTADLLDGTTYTLSFPAGVFQDLAGNNAGSLTLNFSTAAALDTTPPTVSSRVPANNAMNVNIGANVVLTYSEAVQKGSGNITLSSAFGNISVPVSNSLVSISGNVVTIDPMVDLLAGTAYTLSFSAGVIQDLAGNNAGSLTLNFNTAAALDTTPPTIASSVPANGATGVAVGANIVLTYSEAVQKGSGSIALSSAGGMVTISVSSALVSIAGAVVTINPTADLLDGTAYTLSFPAGVFQDLAGNNAGSLTRSFTTAVALDSTPPTIMSTLPVLNGTINSPDNIVLTYSEAVQKGSGNITIGAITIPVSSAQVSIAGAVVTINPTADLLAGTSYTLSFPAGVFQDLAGNNAGSLTLNFNTAAALDTTPPTISSSVPADSATGVAVGANIVLTYSEAVQKGSGSMTISSAGGMVTISVSSALVSIAGAVVTINPSVDLLDGTAYTLSFPAGVFQDLAGNNAGSFTLSFTTAVALDTTAPTVSSSVPVAGGTIETTANIVLTYNEAVQVGSGNITLQPSGGTTVTISVSSTQVSVAGAVVTINPPADLTLTSYTLMVPAGAIEDSSGNISGEYTLSFVAQATMIETIADLENVRNNLAGDYALAANIDLSSIDNWQPIGDGANPFTGSFDGQGYQISGLNSSGYQYAGLFGVMTGGSISNLGVLAGTISSSSGTSAAGGLVGWASNSSISNSYAVVGGNISSSSSSSFSLAGGLVGLGSSSSISNSYVIVVGNISSSTSESNNFSFAGGLVGSINSSPISNSYAEVEGNISSSSSGGHSFAGGLVGRANSNSPISNSYAEVEGNISSSTSGASRASRAGGLVGSINSSPISNSYAVVGGNISSSSTSESNDFSLAGGLVGSANSNSPISNSYAVVVGNISSSTSSSESNSASYAGGLVGEARFNSSISNSYAVVGGNISATSPNSSVSGGLVGVPQSSSISNSYTVVGGDISSSSSAGGLVGSVGADSSISNSYHSASRQSSEGNFTNTAGTSQTVAQLRSLTATGTGWMAFYDASSAPAHVLITDTSATFATGDRRLWHFGDNAQLPILNPSPAQVSASDLSLYRARQHFVATASSTTQVNLSWSSAGATYTFYEVYQHTANDSSGATRVGSPQVSAVGRTYADTGLTTATTYYYWLKACAGSVCSDFFANTQTTTP